MNLQSLCLYVVFFHPDFIPFVYIRISTIYFYLIVIFIDSVNLRYFRSFKIFADFALLLEIFRGKYLVECGVFEIHEFACKPRYKCKQWIWKS